MQSKRKVLYAVLLVVFVWVSLFDHSLPTAVQSTLFVAVLLLALGMIAAGWWGWIRSRKVEDVARWRKWVGLFGVTANTAALAAPVLSLLYMMYYPFLRVGVRLPTINAERMISIVLVLALCGVAAGLFAPPRSRFATALGGLIIGSVVLAMPLGVL